MATSSSSSLLAEFTSDKDDDEKYPIPVAETDDGKVRVSMTEKESFNHIDMHFRFFCISFIPGTDPEFDDTFWIIWSNTFTDEVGVAKST